jgi:tRNA nucleotidyltransferase/poly(A) polymerase
MKFNLWRIHSSHNPYLPKLTLKQMTDKRYEFTNKVTIQPKLVLTDLEIKIFTFLQNVNKTLKSPPVLRVAGGWVRDKLIGKDSKDIDIVLDKFSGKEYVTVISQYQKENNMETHGIGIIKPNAERSKHLETATTWIFGCPIDIVNLRSEVYSDESRVPESVEYGTPSQDAHRRDFTINSMFYNISENKIEDFTEKGIQDLKQGIIRTPLEPNQTFVDDPLRLLRCVRFACNYNFCVSEDIFDASKNSRVHEHLLRKISRERIGVELTKILHGGDPMGGFALLNELNLRDVVFPGFEWKESEWNNALFRSRSLFTKTKESCAAIAGLLSHHFNESMTFEKVSGRIEELVQNDWRLPVKFHDEISKVLFYTYRLEILLDGKNWKDQIVPLGLWIREIKDLWEICMYLNELTGSSGTEVDNEGVFDNVEVLLKELKAFDLPALIKMKAVLNGHDIETILKIKPGKAIGKIIENEIEYQIAAWPRIIGKEEMVDYLTKKYVK